MRALNLKRSTNSITWWQEGLIMIVINFQFSSVSTFNTVGTDIIENRVRIHVYKFKLLTIHVNWPNCCRQIAWYGANETYKIKLEILQATIQTILLQYSSTIVDWKWIFTPRIGFNIEFPIQFHKPWMIKKYEILKLNSPNRMIMPNMVQVRPNRSNFTLRLTTNSFLSTL